MLVITLNPSQSATEFYFYDFIGLGRCEKFWFLEGTTVRYFGLKLQKLFERAAVASRSLRLWQCWKVESWPISLLPRSGHCQVGSFRLPLHASLSNAQSLDSTVEKSEVESLVTPLRDFQNKISDTG